MRNILVCTYTILIGLFFYNCENTIADSSDIFDCNNILNGSASIDDCGVCGGSNLDMDECGICFGSGYTDNCDVCDDDESNDCPEDCAGIDGGTAVVDECGECILEGEHSNCIVINEINYNSLDTNPEDWVEIHNPTSETISIGSWEFRDDNDEVFTIPEDTNLLPGGYLVLCKNTDTFSQEFPDVSNIVGDFVFGLNAAGEYIRLLNSDGLLVDQVEYDDNAPWPTEPDGEGPTLELINPSLDNALEESWAASSSVGGTPGGINSVYYE